MSKKTERVILFSPTSTATQSWGEKLKKFKGSIMFLGHYSMTYKQLLEKLSDCHECIILVLFDGKLSSCTAKYWYERLESVLFELCNETIRTENPPTYFLGKEIEGLKDIKVLPLKKLHATVEQALLEQEVNA